MISVKKQLVTHFQNKNSRVKSNTQFNAVVQITFFLKSLKLQSVLYGTHQTARGNDVLDKGREWLRLIALAGGDIGDNAGVKIHLDLVAVLDVLGCLVTFEDSKTDIEGVAVKDSGECGGDHAGNSRSFDGNGRVFTG